MKISTIITIAAVAVVVSAKSYDQQITCATKGFTGKSYDESKVCCEYSGNCGNLSKCTESFCSRSNSSNKSGHHESSDRNGRPGRPKRSGRSSSSKNEYKITCAEKRKRNPDALEGPIQEKKECCQWSGKCDGLSKCTQSYCEVSSSSGKADRPEGSASTGRPKGPDSAGHRSRTGRSSSSKNEYNITCAEKRKRNPEALEGPIQESKECCQWSGKCDGLSKCTQSYCEVSSSSGKSGHPEGPASPVRPNGPENGGRPGRTGRSSNSKNEYEITCSEKRKRNPEALEGPIQENKECCQWSGKCDGLSKCTQSYCEVSSSSGKPGRPDNSASPTRTNGSDSAGRPSRTGRSTSSKNEYKITCAEKSKRNPDALEGPIKESKECCQWSGKCDGLSKCTQSYCEISSSSGKSDHPEGSESPARPNGPINAGRPIRTVRSSSSKNEYDITCGEKRKRNPDALEGRIHENKECCQWSGKCGNLSKCTQSYCEM